MSRALSDLSEMIESGPGGADPAGDHTVTGLVRRARAGDQAAWEALVEQFTQLLWWVARRHGLTVADGADAVQMTWLRCVEHLDRIREPAFLPAWLITTCRRECLRILRLPHRFPPTDTDDPATAVMMSQGDMRGDPSAEAVLAAERDAAVREAIASLPERQRRVLNALMDSDGTDQSYADMAASLGMPVGSIGPTRGRAMHRLRRDPSLARLREGS